MFLRILDKLACKWIDFRQAQNMKRMEKEDPELAQEVGLKKVSAENGNLEMVLSHPSVFMLADDFAGLLNEFGGENYLEFRMMPRIDRGVRPIEVVVKWAGKLSPAQKASKLFSELQEVHAQINAFVVETRRDDILTEEYSADQRIHSCLYQQYQPNKALEADLKNAGEN